MDEPEGFLTRWSRRKREAEQAEPVAQAEAQAARHDDVATPEPPKTIARDHGAEPEPRADPIPEFDLSKLPSIESITATTDIRQFLTAGVPPELTRAALRRAWVADPAIRDFIGLSENAWDFNAGDIPGFDPSPPTGDLTRMVANIFGEHRQSNDVAPDQAEPLPATAEAPQVDAPEADSARLTAQGQVDEDAAAATSENEKESGEPGVAASHEAQDAAMQNEAAPPDRSRPMRRGHGGALPS
jgi:Protein of unknown function (DUF3306)